MPEKVSNKKTFTLTTHGDYAFGFMADIFTSLQHNGIIATFGYIENDPKEGQATFTIEMPKTSEVEN